ncbi:LAMI_0C04104g1_1 [Lachancea mirantina]|uniref:Pre-rRNA-processing protein n=1 Tax=Lachancea mirantina TaxID=1230905 RepID=A0A1G4J1Y2_9SACH|nr:LAMI_0C04104g1_1 [Lachancea mirantina]
MAKKKTLKQQDFQKKKLKVGKAKQGPSNLTDTSFVAKTILLPNQTKLSSAERSSGTRKSGQQELEQSVIKRLSLCKHHSAITRKETLVHFKQQVPKIAHSGCMTQIMHACYPMMCDDDRQVREALLEMIDEVGQYNCDVLRLNCRAFVLFLSSAMTHILSPVQRDCGKFLACGLKYFADELTRNSWIKLLRGMFGVLGWPLKAESPERNGNGNNGNRQPKKSVSMAISSASVVNMNSARAKHARAINIDALHLLIKCGCLELVMRDDPQPDEHSAAAHNKYLIPECPQPYEHLKIFAREIQDLDDINQSASSLQDLVSVSFQDASSRRKVVLHYFYDDIMSQVATLIADGGESGKSANSLKLLMDEVQVRESESEQQV